MAGGSTEFLDVEDVKVPNLHRSRSGGYADHLEEREKWDRRDRERQMKRYHDSRYSSQNQSSDRNRLDVPTFDTSHRRVRSYDGIGEKKEEPMPRYNVREDKPRTLHEPYSEAAQSSQLPVRQRRPSIKVQIHQDDTPSSRSPRGTPRKSPSASPRSPSAQPQLLFQYSTLQHKLAEISTTCAPYLDVEAANPRDLTFFKISEQAKGFAFDFQVWSHIVKLEKMDRIDTTKRRQVDAASHTLDRLIKRVSELSEACGRAKPRDLRVPLIPDVDDDGYDDLVDTNEERGTEDATESLGFIIQSHLNSIQFQLQILKRLTRPLQEATPDAKVEVVAVSSLVREVERFFGSPEAIERYPIDPKYAGRKALEEARYAAGSVR